jgi:hypothetical protein
VGPRKPFQGNAGPAPERQPGVRVELFADEPLGPESFGLGVEVVAMVRGVSRGHHHRAGRQLVAAEGHRRFCLSAERGQHRIRPERFLDDSVEVFEARSLPFRAFRVDLGRELSVYLVIAQDELEDPAQHRGCRLVTGQEQRDQLVAQLLVGHRAPLLVAGLKQH